MPPAPSTLELHTAITNMHVTESSVSTPKVSPGSLGLGNELPLNAGSVSETRPHVEMEAVLELTAPDVSELLDIGAASFGAPAALETVIGTDERVRINDTKQYPWRVTASLLITAADNSQWIGTAWFISPRTLATAGHCVYIKNSGVPGRDGWVKKIQVMPGRNGTEVPFGGLSATEFWSVKGWGEQGLETFDYGAIILPSAFPSDLGFFGFGVFDDATLLASTVNIAGYPGDKTKGTLWYDSRETGSVNPDKVFYTADTAGGQSGACAYIIQDGKRIGIGVHAYGGNTSNSGTRINSQVFDNLESWKRT